MMIKTINDDLGFNQSEIELHADGIVKVINLTISFVIFAGRLLFRKRRT